ncbi:hypothetical protein Scep_028644 [Stephania cephalantha]|uniref:non-specific serine/threonine protein kinase n=1 Tax=Stephania cephalantha TaxID=152367 RepID=A0AAP0HM02_9MAGN
MASFFALLLLVNFFADRDRVFSATDDIITHNKFLRDGDKIVSNGGTYALGFFSPGNSQQRYIGIWYNKDPQRTVVWVANREDPINGSSSGVVKVDERGNLGIFNGNASTTPIWSTNVSIPISNKNSFLFYYKLLDSGNLVLCDGENGADFLWRSFDYPTDTYLPGMKVGFSLKSGLIWTLTSWKSPDDPSTGDFTFSMSRVGMPEVVIKKGSQKIWRSGPWTGDGWNGVPGMKPGSIVNHSLVNNPDEIYTTYIIYETSILSRVMLDYLGFAQTITRDDTTGRWTVIRSIPDDSCDNYGKCGAFGSCRTNVDPACSCLSGFELKSFKDWFSRDGSQGCVRKRELLCGKGDGFLKLEKMKLPDTSNSRVNRNLSTTECEIECRNNCSCTGYSSADVYGRGCLSWFGDLNDVKEFPEWGQDLFVRVDAIELENSMKHSKGSSFTKKKLVLLCVLIAGGLLILISAFCYSFKKAKRRGLLQREGLQKQLHLPSLETNEETNARFELPIFDLNSLMVATENFSIANKLGAGGFGSVYKGKLSDGREIAVKRLSKNSGQGMIEFKNEIELIAKLQHRNLVQIIGCCIEEEEKMIVYEYMPNKSLDFLLFNQTRSISLDWRMRCDIILGIARGVLYLHQDSRLRIIHRDLKASNVLLDAKMNPKISDFGMARIFGGDQSQANTRRVVGT